MDEIDLELTDNDEINKQLLTYFWWLIGLTFLGQIITYTTMFISGSLDRTQLGNLSLGAVNTLIIGGGIRLVQKQMSSVINRYNKNIKSQKTNETTISTLREKINTLEGQLNSRDAEIIFLKTGKRTSIDKFPQEKPEPEPLPSKKEAKAKVIEEAEKAFEKIDELDEI